MQANNSLLETDSTEPDNPSTTAPHGPLNGDKDGELCVVIAS